MRRCLKCKWFYNKLLINATLVNHALKNLYYPKFILILNYRTEIKTLL